MDKMCEKLLGLMKEKNIKTAELSRITNIPYTTLRMFLQGNTAKLDMIKLQTICNALDCSLDYVMKDSCDNVHGEKQVYYLDKETAEYANEIHKNPDLKILFDASRGAKKEDIQLAVEMIQRLKNNSMN